MRARERSMHVRMRSCVLACLPPGHCIQSLVQHSITRTNMSRACRRRHPATAQQVLAQGVVAMRRRIDRAARWQVIFVWH